MLYRWCVCFKSKTQTLFIHQKKEKRRGKNSKATNIHTQSERRKETNTEAAEKKRHKNKTRKTLLEENKKTKTNIH